MQVEVNLMICQMNAYSHQPIDYLLALEDMRMTQRVEQILLDADVLEELVEWNLIP